MAYDAGTAFISIQPSFRGFVTAVDAQFAKYGAEAGQIFGSSFKESVKRGTSDTEVGPSDADTAKKGESSGGAFADAFKTRVDAALKSLPDASVGLDDEEAKLKLDDIRLRLETLSNVNIGVDIKDVDALAAIEVLQVDLAELAVRSPSIRVSVDAAKAIAELEAVKVAADEASGEKGVGGAGSGGLSGVVSSASGIVSGGPIAIGVLALLATALIPIAAAATGAAIALTAMAVAATAGIGAFAIAALPVIKNVSTAYQQIGADQLALSRATTTATKNTAITHLQDDLNNLSPVVRTVTLGVLAAKQVITDWSNQFSPLIIRVFNAAVADLAPILNAITPLVTAGGNALVGFFRSVGAALQQADFKQFISWLAGQVGPAISSFTKTFINFAGGFSKMFEASAPLISQIEKALPGMAKSFEKFASSKSFKDFIDWVVKNGPTVVKDIEAIAKTVGDFIGRLAPLGLLVLNFVADLALIYDWIQGKLTFAFRKLIDFFENSIPNALDHLRSFFHQAWSDISNIVSTTWNWIRDNVFTPIGNAINGVGLGMDSLKKTWGVAWGAIQSVVQVAATAIAKIIQGITDAINAVKGAVNWLSGAGGAPTPGAQPGGGVTANPPLHAAGTGMGTFQGTTWVGERGPELVNFGKPVQIIPNHALAGLGGGADNSRTINMGGVTLRDGVDVDLLTRKLDFNMRAGVL
jgi:hypothetical protein